MSDFIRREDVIAVLCFSQETGQMVCGDLRKLLEEIKAIPSAEPERKNGEWLPHPGDDDWDVCSACGSGCKRREHNIDGWWTEYNYNFCPNCGAYMRRKNGNNLEHKN